MAKTWLDKNMEGRLKMNLKEEIKKLPKRKQLICCFLKIINSMMHL